MTLTLVTFRSHQRHKQVVPNLDEAMMRLPPPAQASHHFDCSRQGSAFAFVRNDERIVAAFRWLDGVWHGGAFHRDDLDEFTSSYIETMLWSSNDESDERGGEPLDKNYGADDLSDEAIARCFADCAAFQAVNSDNLATRSAGQGGHDFWLTRNGHGAGFWDGDWEKEIGQALTKSAKEFGEENPYVGDDGQIHL